MEYQLSYSCHSPTYCIIDITAHRLLYRQAGSGDYDALWVSLRVSFARFMRDEHPKTSHPIPECIFFLFVKRSMVDDSKQQLCPNING